MQSTAEADEPISWYPAPRYTLDHASSPGLRHLHPVRRLGVRPGRLRGFCNPAPDHDLPGLGAHHRWKGPVAGAWVFFTAMLIAAPSLWLAYNAKQFGDPLDFLRGPYSAQAIDARTTPPGSSPHPGVHDLRVAAIYFLESCGAGRRPVGPGKAVVLAQCCRHAGGIVGLSPPANLAGVAAMGAAALLCLLRGLWIGAHLHPHLAAISWYNTRYGLELLPAFALFVGCLFAVLIYLLPRFRLYAMLAVLLLLVANSVAVLRSRPLVFQEAAVNSRSRIAFETALAKSLLGMPEQGLILMHISNDVGAVQQAGIPLRRIVNEGDYLTWQRALKDPSRGASMVVAVEGDDVSLAVQRHPEGLQLINVICSTGQPCARIYRSHPATR